MRGKWGEGGHSQFSAQAWLGTRKTDLEISESGAFRGHRSYPNHLQKGKQVWGEKVMYPKSQGRLVAKRGWNPSLYDPSVPGCLVGSHFSALKSVESLKVWREPLVAQGTFARTFPARNLGPPHSDPPALIWPGQNHSQRFPRKGIPSSGNDL